MEEINNNRFVEDGTVYCCPSCSCENLHLMHPIFKGLYESCGADYYITIPFWCESGCNGFIEWHHHEGTTIHKIYGENK